MTSIQTLRDQRAVLQDARDKIQTMVNLDVWRRIELEVLLDQAAYAIKRQITNRAPRICNIN